ncbi:fibropellin-3-like isoform X2 [Acanthaster planci]|uniref:Fibropellin-3-like isoform X2 n=1 Tax=Acanthaster planci TaxID=133434 RepID=A0A8B7YX99_ACAPL|nr:fibropellin-3-like isoform X2 [Acanthaster planci]
MSDCTCVSSGNAVCNKANGSCTCNKQFSEATCDKAMIAISTFEPLGAAPIRDDSSVNDVNMRCHVNIAETDLRSVDIIFPDNSQNAMTKVQEGVWEYTLQDVHPINSGVYTCHATANPIPSDGVFDIRRTFNLTVTDVNECDEDLDNCHVNATCTNGIGGFTCMCVNGFTGNGVQCADINECDPSCSINCDTCHTDATCTNTIGSYTCACNAGYSGNGVTCQECVEGKYGFNCAENCTCVDPMPGPNDVMCRKSDGFCECNKAEFIGKTCEKRNLTVTLMPDPNPVLNRPGIDNITWRCMVNLHSRDLVLPVTITYPNGSIWPMNMSEEGLYERIQSGVTPNDNGRYTCTAAAVGMDPVTGHFDLDVLIDGRIISVSDPVEGEVGDTVRINCTVYARSDVDIAWYFGNNQIIDDAKYAITKMSLGDFEQISYLTVHNLIATDNGSYVCSATDDTRGALIVLIERPVIGNVEISAVSFDQLRVSWDITFDGNLPPPICHVNYSSTSTGLFLSSPGSPVTDVSHIVTDLQPYTEYYVRVQCTNKVGSSNILLGGLQRTLKTNPSEPRNLAAGDIQPDRFNVMWNEPAMTNGPIDGYKVNVTRQSDGAIIKMDQVLGRSFPVEGLTAYTEYTVVVIAFNTEGGQDLASNPTQRIFKTSQESLLHCISPAWDRIKCTGR